MAHLGVVKYRIYQDKRKGVPSTGKWYAKAVQDRTVEFEQFVSHMAEHNTPYSRGVIHGVLIDMLSCLKELVLDGKSVRLGDLGLVSLGMNTIPADSADKFSVGVNIQGVHLNVRNTKMWSNAELRKHCRLEELTSYQRLHVTGPSPVGGSEFKPGDSSRPAVEPHQPVDPKPGEVKPGGGGDSSLS